MADSTDRDVRSPSTSQSDRPSLRDPASDEPFVVGVAASADGLTAFETFFESLPDETGLLFVVAQHLDPDRESKLEHFLADASTLPVERARQGEPVRRDHVYVLPPGKQISVTDGDIQLRDMPSLQGGRKTIDFLFRSLAEQHGERAVGVLLSGAGTDGTTGLRIIKEHGGVTFAQDPDEAGVPSMPQNAINSGVADFVLPSEHIVERLLDLPKQRRMLGPFDSGDEYELEDEEKKALNHIMALLRERTGTDLSKYKRPTVLRRIGRRMQVRQVDTLETYLGELESNAEELDALFDELLIGVTRFFRNPEAWSALTDEVFPELFADKTAEDSLRVWVPGCATGEEAYTLAVLLTHYADGLEDSPEIKVFATDIDRTAIDYARRASYPSAIASDVPSDLLSRYFRTEDERNRIVKSVRRRVMFAAHNVLTDPPFSNLDLVTCRNLAIYLGPGGQQRLLEILHYSLHASGFLMLGESESVTTKPELFETFDDDHRIFRAAPDSDTDLVRTRPAFGFDPTRPHTHDVTPSEADERDVGRLHRDAVLARHAPTSVLVDADHQLVHVIGEAGLYLSVRPGRTTGEVVEMVDEEIQSTVRTMLFEAFQTEQTPIRRRLDDDGETVELEAVRVDDDLVELSFLQPTKPDVEAAEPSTDQQDRVEQLERELEQTRNRLQSTIQEYEVSNQKLRASNEELMSMNEELQSTTEELQTSKEELQSMNEELTTVNDELNDKIEELDAANSDLRNLMRSTDIGTLFLDRQLNIKRFTDPVTEYVNLIPSDEGRPFDHVTHTLEADAGDLAEDAHRAMETPTTIEREIDDREGRHLLVRFLPYLNLDNQIDGAVMTFLDITDRKEVEDRLARSEKKFRSVFEQAADPMFVYPLDDGIGTFIEVNEAAIAHVGCSREELREMTIDDVLDGEEFDADRHLRELLEYGESTGEARLANLGPGEPVPVDVRGRRITVDETEWVVELVRDLSVRKRYRQALDDKKRAEELAELRSMFLATLSHDIRSPLAAIVTMTGLLRRQIGDEHTDLVDRIERSTGQLRKILDSILRMARLDLDEALAEPEAVELVSQIEEIADVHQALAEKKGLEFRYEGLEPPVEARLDPRFLAQMLNNLLDNAVKYTDDGEVTIQLETAEECVRISVIDTGPGIPQKECDRIFERSKTGPLESEDYYSEGLGLAITKELAEAMEGTVSVESHDGEGSTFTIELPRETGETG